MGIGRQWTGFDLANAAFEAGYVAFEGGYVAFEAGYSLPEIIQTEARLD